MSSPAEYSGHPHPELEETQGQEKRAKIDGAQPPPSAGAGGGGPPPLPSPLPPSGAGPYGGGGGYPHHHAAAHHHGGYYGYPPSQHEYGASPGGGQGGYHGGPPPPHDYYGYHPHHPHSGYGGDYGPPPPHGHGGSPGYYSQQPPPPTPPRHHQQGSYGGAPSPQFGVQPRIGNYGEGGGGGGESFDSRPEKPSGEAGDRQQQPAQPPGLGSPSGQPQGALDSRSPEGSRNLNSIEERMAGSPSGSVVEGSSPKVEPPSSSEGHGAPTSARPQLALQPPLTEEAAAAGDAARQEQEARKEEAGRAGEGGGGDDAPKRDGAPKSEPEESKAAAENQGQGQGSPSQQPPAGQQPPPHYEEQGYYPPPHADYGPPPLHGPHGHPYYPPYYPPPSHDQHHSQAHHHQGHQGPPPPIHQGYADGYGAGHGHPMPMAHYGAPSHPPGYGPPHPSQGPRDPDFGRRRNKTQKPLPVEALSLVDQDVEYCHNVDRPTYLLSTPYDGGSLSDRQCYVRSHFVELFVAGPEDTVSRHSRGNQRLYDGQIGLRCAYCAKLRPADRAERAICYPSSISRMYQTVADMQRFHFESCPAIPHRIRQTYRTLKTTRPRGQGSPQAYWMQSARDIGLVDTNVDGGNKQNIKVGSMQLLDMQLKVESGLTVTEDGRLRAEAHAYGHAPPPPANQGMGNQGNAAPPLQPPQQQPPQGGGPAGAPGAPPSTVSFPVKHEYPPAGYGGPGEYGPAPHLPHGDGQGYGAPPPPGGYGGPAPQSMAAGLAPPLPPPSLAPPIKMEEGSSSGAAVVSSPGSDTECPKSALSTPESPVDRKVQHGGGGAGGAQADDAEMLLLLKNNTPDSSPQEDDSGAGRGASMEGAPVLENCAV